MRIIFPDKLAQPTLHKSTLELANSLYLERQACPRLPDLQLLCCSRNDRRERRKGSGWLSGIQLPEPYPDINPPQCTEEPKSSRVRPCMDLSNTTAYNNAGALTYQAEGEPYLSCKKMLHLSIHGRFCKDLTGKSGSFGKASFSG